MLLWPDVRDEELDLADAVDGDATPEIVLEGRTAVELARAPLIAAQRIVVKGTVDLPSDRVLVANEIVFEAGARIRVPSGHITVIAPRMTGVHLDVSGARGADGRDTGDAGRDGGKGGSIYLAGAMLTEVRLNADGGTGGNGQRGYAGAPGRDANCGPIGRFRVAERGKPGGNGGKAGDGGDGGLVTVLHRYDPPQATAERGKPGRPARGGPGGRGGKGCDGIRGKQPGQSRGDDGATGQAGTLGQAGTVKMRPVAFADVIESFEEWQASGTDSPERLRDRLRLVTTMSS